MINLNSLFQSYLDAQHDMSVKDYCDAKKVFNQVVAWAAAKEALPRVTIKTREAAWTGKKTYSIGTTTEGLFTEYDSGIVSSFIAKEIAYSLKIKLDIDEVRWE